MRLLLDTHALIWFCDGNPALRKSARELLVDPEHEKFVSTASIWEMAIKVSTGKLNFPSDFAPHFKSQMAQNGFELLPISYEHAAAVSRLPCHHGDPFDRLLVAQCQGERLALVSRDPAFDAYGIKRVW
jgi:PIN domain nuclease of toxin-antitoxin system